MLKLTTFAPGMVYANCYIVTDEGSKEAFVVDPGVYNKRFEAALRAAGVEKLRYILLTHGHFDHISGVKALKEDFGGDVVIHREDAGCLYDKSKSLASKFFFPQHDVTADVLVDDGQRLPFGEGEIEVIHTPGHTKGSVCYTIEDIMLSGDTLFKSSIGRTDFPGGSIEEMKESLKRLAALERNYTVYPGHAESTTLEREKKYNPYV